MAFIQRFDGELDFNIHFHMPVLDGFYICRPDGGVRLLPAPSPTSSELLRLVERIAHRIGRHLDRRSLLVCDAEKAHLDWDSEQASALDDLAGHSITYTDPKFECLSNQPPGRDWHNEAILL